MVLTPWRAMLLATVMLFGMTLLSTCSGSMGNIVYVQDVVSNPDSYVGQEVTVDGAYVWRPGDPALSVLALGVSTLDSGLDAQPLGDAIWLESFPPEVSSELHRPGDAVYGFVRVTGVLEQGTFGPDGSYPLQLTVSDAQPIEQVRYVEQRIPREASTDEVVSFYDLVENPDQYNGQTVTTRGYYFWNSVIYVLAEGIQTEETGGSPQPLGDPIWMEGFPPDLSAELTVGPNTSYVWGAVEVTGTFETGGGKGKDGAYQSILTVESARVLNDQ